MTRLIFDIETVGVEFESLDIKSREILLAYTETPKDEENIKDGLGFSPLTGEIVAIGIYNPDTNKGGVYYRAEKLDRYEKNDIQYTPVSNEQSLLEEFWQTAQFYDQFVTFNGRVFDCPYLIIRSAIHKIKPTKNLMPNRYETEQYGKIITHVDLLDRLTFFGSVRRKGNLHMWCQAFDIESPKDKGVTGNDVAKLFKEKKYSDIAEYCGGDLKATAELFRYWEKYVK